MQRPTPRPCRRARLPVRQLDLCLANEPPAAIAPRWNSLPDPIRQTVTGLVTRLLIAHASDGVVEVNGLSEDSSDER